MLILYTILYIHLLPFFVVRLFIRARKAPAYGKRIGERFAMIPARKDKAPLIWLHAVSVGEVIAAIPVVKQLQQSHPEHRICITTTTPTGSERVKAAFADSVLHYYLPYDVPSLILRFILAIRPQKLIIMETELWPNLLMVCQDKKIPVYLANGRMSERSAKGYQRFASLTRPMLQRLSAIAAQSEADKQRFIALGAAPEKVFVTGSIKFDVVLNDVVYQRVAALRAQLQLEKEQRKVMIFASTHIGEDEQIVPMIQRLSQQFPDLLCILVPRHPERFAVVKQLLEQAKLNTVTITEQQAITPQTQVILGDTMGDMLALYGLANCAFIGGSLIKHGGHNMLEPALWALPMVCGQHVFNFQTISDSLVERQGLCLVESIEQLEQVLALWLGKEQAPSDGQAALQFLQENQGALQRLMDVIEG